MLTCGRTRSTNRKALGTEIQLKDLKNSSLSTPLNTVPNKKPNSMTSNGQNGSETCQSGSLSSHVRPMANLKSSHHLSEESNGVNSQMKNSVWELAVKDQRKQASVPSSKWQRWQTFNDSPGGEHTIMTSPTRMVSESLEMMRISLMNQHSIPLEGFRWLTLPIWKMSIVIRIHLVFWSDKNT